MWLQVTDASGLGALRPRRQCSSAWIFRRVRASIGRPGQIRHAHRSTPSEEVSVVALKHPRVSGGPSRELSIGPLFNLGSDRIPRHELPAGEMSPDAAYQIVHDELMLDGNARLNVATFVTTWMEPQADRLMAECFDKNMIDKDEYPQTAEIETRCVRILSNLWHAPDAHQATGCSTTGSSEAAM